MHRRNPQTVPGDTNEAAQALVSRLEQGFYCAAGCERGAPLVFLDQVVELNQIHLLDPEAVEASLQAGPCVGPGAVAGLGGKEELVTVIAQKRRQTQFRLSVRCRGVDVIDTAPADQVEGVVGAVLAH